MTVAPHPLKKVKLDSFMGLLATFYQKRGELVICLKGEIYWQNHWLCMHWSLHKMHLQVDPVCRYEEMSNFVRHNDWMQLRKRCWEWLKQFSIWFLRESMGYVAICNFDFILSHHCLLHLRHLKDPLVSYSHVYIPAGAL